MTEPGPAGVPSGSALAAAVADLTAEIAALHADRARRRLLDLATGALSAQLSIPPDEAADHLVHLAVSTGLGAVDTAADIVNAAAGAHVVEVPEGRPGALSDARRARRGMAATLASDSVGEALDTLLEGGLGPLGVRSVFLWRRTETGCLELVGQAGASRPEASHWQWVPPECGGPLHRALQGGLPVWLPDGQEKGGEPMGARGPPRLPGAGPNGARVLFPIRRAGGTAGLLLAAWEGPVSLDEGMRREFADLAEPAGRVVDWARDEEDGPRGLSAVLDLLEQPAAIIATAGPGREVVEYVNAAARRAVGEVHDPVGRPAAQVFPYSHEGLVRLITAAAGGGGPQFAPALPQDGPAPESGSMAHVKVLALARERAAVVWDTVDTSPVLVRVLGRLARIAWFEDDLMTGRSRWSPKAYAIFGLGTEADPLPLRMLGPRVHAEDEDDLKQLLAALTERREGAQAQVRVTRPDGGVRRLRIAAEPVLTQGVLTGVAGVYQDVTAQHHTELALSASFDRLTAAQAEAEMRNQVVLRLQQALQPESPPLETLPGLEIAARYRPALAEYRVGGDWYDVHPLPCGRVLVSVGDIAGHGIDAATAMTALRNALHGLAFTGAAPGQLMGWLNEVTLSAPGQPTATAVCALYDPGAGVVRWTTAGHLPPLLVRDGRGRFLEPPHTVLLGALPGAVYADRTTKVRPGDFLLFYTDGLVERRHEGLDESLAVLRRAAERLGAERTDELADLLMAEVSGDTDDDTSLVVLRVC
ncbi:SpoIIE family protein phosphatase [Streptomyces sp. NPDC059072]|uniref:SpoIIE family protein phosphatase n=1 Tax=Streptomyces sp. NPDC059072 TaxID=3346715 RepID=UPI0036C0DA87